MIPYKLTLRVNDGKKVSVKKITFQAPDDVKAQSLTREHIAMATRCFGAEAVQPKALYREIPIVLNAEEFISKEAS
jgi:hypothetical protein